MIAHAERGYSVRILWLKSGSLIVGKHTEYGQAALFATVLIPIVLLTALFVFNTGQLAATKLKTQNAADAAAFSAMKMEARELNFISYTNRAMIANQVAIGQTISLVSWSHYVKTFGLNIQRLGALVSWIPVVGQATVTITNAIAQTTNALDQGIDAASKVILPALDIADAALSGAQEIYHMTNGIFDPGSGNTNPGGAITAVAEQMVKLNDPDARINGMVLTTNLSQYFIHRGDLIKRWGGNKENAQARMAYMINASRDGFTRERNDLPSVLRPLGSLTIFPFKVGITKSGGGQIAMDKSGTYAWSGMDTLSLRVWAWSCRWSGCGWRGGLEAPLGWGAAQSGGGNEYDYFRSSYHYQEINSPPQSHFPPPVITQDIPPYGHSWDRNPQTSRLASYSHPEEQDTYGNSASSEALGDSHRRSAGGITRYQDFNRSSTALDSSEGDPADAMPSYIVVVEHARQIVRDASTAMGISHTTGQGKMNMILPQSAQGGQVRALAKAQTYFRRPASLWQRGDKYHERGNLFSPFWEARLVDTNMADRTQYAALLGLH